jgi:hypothetical protein
MIDDRNSWMDHTTANTTSLMPDGVLFADDTTLPLHVGGYYGEAVPSNNSKMVFHEIHVADGSVMEGG